jgi:glycosyltransferase involved in cell wall biosynthesis
MMSNAVPVASRTGFAPEIIRHGENGFVFNIDATAEEIADLVESAYEITANVRDAVEHMTWENLSASIVRLAE